MEGPIQITLNDRLGVAGPAKSAVGSNLQLLQEILGVYAGLFPHVRGWGRWREHIHPVGGASG